MKFLLLALPSALASILASTGAAAISPSSSSTAVDLHAAATTSIGCDDFMDALESLAVAAGTSSPRRVAGYSQHTCKSLMRAMSKDFPDFVSSIVNLGSFYKSRDARQVKTTDIVPDVASGMVRSRSTRTTTSRQLTARKLYDVDPIGLCVDPEYDVDMCPHAPCLPPWLIPEADVAEYPTVNETHPMPDLDGTDTYNDFLPGYWGNVDYLEILPDGMWDGEAPSRTDQNTVGDYLILSIAATTLALANEYVCEALEDNILNLLGFPPVPNPVKIICQVLLAILQEAAHFLDVIMEWAGFLDAAVDSAEIEATYEHSRNLLQKQCAIYDQAVCRCVISEDTEDHTNAYGLGCDGKDSNCNDFVDECDEDQVPPEIVIDDSLCACNNADWFYNGTEALACVESSMTITDDCQTTNHTLVVDDNCAASNVTINAQDVCGNSAEEKVVPVQIDGEDPHVTCGFTDGASTTTHLVITADTTGPSVLMNTNLDYTATDNCNGPLNVTVKVYSNEIEDFNAQKLALFYKSEGATNDKAGLYIAKGICSTVNNGQCIKEGIFTEQRLYTVEVIAVDPAGLSNRTECFIEIQPKGNTKLKGKGSILKDISESKQRFLLTTYFSKFYEGI